MRGGTPSHISSLTKPLVSPLTSTLSFLRPSPPSFSLPSSFPPSSPFLSRHPLPFSSRLGGGTRCFSTSVEEGNCSADFTTIGFIGLGNMGLPMARNLVLAGYNIVAYDKDQSHMNEAVKAGAKGAASVADVAKQSTMIISMLPQLEHVEKVYMGDDGVFDNLRHSNTLLIEASTIGPVGSGKMIEEARNRGHRMIDAPVSGGVVAAAGGTLTFMVGSTEAEFKAIEPLLRRVGRTVVHCGGPTKGQAVKVCNNLILGCTMMGVSEGYRLAAQLGVDINLFNNVVNNSSGRCWSSELYNPVPGIVPGVPASRAYKGGFAVRLMAKDLRLALDAGETSNVGLSGAQEISKMYTQLEEEGHGELDFSCVYRHAK